MSKKMNWIYNECLIEDVFRDFKEGLYSHILIHLKDENEYGEQYVLISNRNCRDWTPKEDNEIDGVIPFEDLDKKRFSHCFTRQGLNRIGEQSEIFIEKKRYCYDYFTRENISPFGPYYRFDGSFIDDEERNGEDIVVSRLKEYGIKVLVIPTIFH